MNLKGIFLIIAASLLWSTGGPLMRGSRLGWAGYILCANLSAVLVMLIVYRRRIFRGIRGFPLKLFLFMSVALSVNVITFFMAFENTTITINLLIHSIAPVIVVALSPLLLKEQRSRYSILALSLALTGVVLVFCNNLFDSSGAGPKPLLGSLLSLISAIGYAGMIMSTRVASRQHLDPVVIAVIIALPATFIVIPFVDFSALHTSGVGIAAIAGILHIVVAAVIYCKALSVITAETAGILGYSEVLFGTLWDFLLYKTHFNLWIGFGSILIITSGWLIFHGRKDPEGVLLKIEI